MQTEKKQQLINHQQYESIKTKIKNRQQAQ